tara:strand:- start:1120 stop:1338 length:219 start_codon:yes stop_codon:yes gene_type:complete
MGLIFKDINDDQQESMMKTMHIGNTWEYRYFKLKAYFWGTVSTLSGITVTAIADYCIVKWTDYSGIIGWIMG